MNDKVNEVALVRHLIQETNFSPKTVKRIESWIAQSVNGKDELFRYYQQAQTLLQVAIKRRDETADGVDGRKSLKIMQLEINVYALNAVAGLLYDPLGREHQNRHIIYCFNMAINIKMASQKIVRDLNKGNLVGYDYKVVWESFFKNSGRTMPIYLII